MVSSIEPPIEAPAPDAPILKRRRCPTYIYRHLRRFIISIVLIITVYWSLSAVYDYLNPNTRKSDEENEDAKWIATSKWWLDRQSCRWLGLCGVAHYRPDPAAISWKDKRDQIPLGDEYTKHIDWQDIIGGNRPRPGDWEGDSRVLKDIPQFVLDHAPLIHLYSKEEFWPSDIAEHLMHTAPYTNHSSLHMSNTQHNVFNLHKLNEIAKGKYLYMHSKEDVEKRPEWLSSAYNKPVPYDDGWEEVDTYTEFTADSAEAFKSESWYDPGAPKQAEPLDAGYRAQDTPEGRPSRSELKVRRRSPALPAPGGYSPAPAILVLVNKGNGVLDAFWFYFYSYNLGTTVFNIRFGNHIGDWEHSLIRFQNGVPKAVFFSAHSGGLAYSYNAVEKGKGKGREGRPVLYSALGSHAMYATPGKHPYVLPFGLLADVTDKGPLWDPAQNYLAYHFKTNVTKDQDAKYIKSTQLTDLDMEDRLQPASSNPDAPMGWWWYKGHWGDKFYILGDLRQWRFAGQYHYVNGPLGPRYKNLGRSKVCQSRGSCTILESIEEGKGKSWVGR
ncbi:hypothetical protein G7Y89_g216 [Cudoniella acicularis]|uniref:Vacuolar protein sorting-associated protein TDA6 n=1 Tax=Cudoniella acicularis TaxID=354080 RepID=A0A8H4RXK3_9HELO|nr:hypothetical protein G7Y89_g216 [Cudoniella acicularis]